MYLNREEIDCVEFIDTLHVHPMHLVFIVAESAFPSKTLTTITCKPLTYY